MKTCGKCTACCYAPELPELNKPVFTPCQFLQKGRALGCCTKYADRPKPCVSFECSWKANEWMQKRHKPNECGLLLFGRDDGIFVVFEMDDRKWEGSELQKLTRQQFVGKRVAVHSRNNG